MFRHWHRRLWSSIAALAVLLNALVPALSQAQAAEAGRVSGWTEVCSANGSLWLRLDAGGRVLERRDTRPDDAPAGLHGAACGYCLPHAASFALLTPEPTIAVPLAPAVEVRPLAQPRRIARSDTWFRPEARGPPQG